MSEAKVKLVFPEPKKNTKLAGSLAGVIRGEKAVRIFDIEEILNWFKKLEVKEIEFWMETIVKTGKMVQLIISDQEKGGIKVKLTPKILP